MRASNILFAALSGLCLAAGTAQAQPSAAPVRKPGFWETTMTMEGPHAHVMVTKICTDAALERRTATFGGANPGKDCAVHEMHRTVGGFAFRSVCKRHDVTTTTAGTATGDFNSRYRVESTTRISAASGPPGRERHMVMDNRWLGACPAGRKPGDLVLSNGEVMSMGAPK
jgi:hypothetical protein